MVTGTVQGSWPWWEALCNLHTDIFATDAALERSSSSCCALAAYSVVLLHGPRVGRLLLFQIMAVLIYRLAGGLCPYSWFKEQLQPYGALRAVAFWIPIQKYLSCFFRRSSR